MSPIAVIAVAWLSVNVLMVVLALNWAAARKRAASGRVREMVDTAERYANARSAPAAPVVRPRVSSARRRASMT